MVRSLSLILRPLLLVAVLVFVLTPARADGIQDNIPENVRRIPELGVTVPEERANAMREKLARLEEKIEQIRSGNDAKAKALLPDVMIFERAVRCALDYNEFFDVKEFDKADELLQTGMIRAGRLLNGDSGWLTDKGLVVRGYISRIDQTVQPYGLVIPPTYAIDNSVPTRCDIWFHGRGEKLSEVNFLWDRMHNPGEFTPEHTIMLHPYGRYCNAFKFAGEVDVLEALEDAQKKYRIDEDRISVRGFSMGGAACWQFATHYSDRWFAANPGAGFSETPQFLKVFQNEELKPTPWEQTLWNLYDCDKWALNLTHCPTIAYSGEVDKQKQAADVMEVALARRGIRLRHIIGKEMGHRYDAESKTIVSASLATLAKSGRSRTPQRVKFETYSLRYNRMHWLTIDAMDTQWSRALVRASIHSDHNERNAQLLLNISTDNVSALTVHLSAGAILADDFHSHPVAPPRTAVHIRRFPSQDPNALPEAMLLIDGPLSDGSLRFSIERNEQGTWKLTTPADSLRKRHNLQGPIDDAFMDSFIFVRPTGTAANEAVGKWADAELTRAVEHWRRHFRGDARVVNDVDVTDEMIQSANLILWGDPKSNSIMAKIADKLPIQWTADKITVGEKSYDASNHAPILIHPNPLNLNRYVVLNSSFTFRDYAYLNNARQVPMLPDWAIIDLNTPPNSVWPGKVVAADFFDEQWQLK
ncbi:MAG TPA: prolyl oligopeptidase family serine peptidase [Planctomycetaceae bacterium]|nr:prolyl oligopeptidase family serine peptidase [Planctomycetaceae bacterium]